MGTEAAALREINRSLARFEYHTGKSVLQSRPRALFIELTRYCNLSCAMCRTPQQVSPSERMSEQLFELIEAELIPTADMVDLRGWGESLILPEFPNRARRAARFGAALRVVTNLSFRRDEVLNLLADLGFYVGISIDSADAEVLSILRGGAKLSLIEANLRRLSEQYSQSGIGDRLNLYVTCQQPALDGLQHIVDLAARNGIFDVRLGPVTVESGSLLSLSSALPSVHEALSRIRLHAEREGVRVSITASLVEGMLPKAENAACLHPWAWCYIAYDGRVGFCDHLIGPAGDPYLLGSLEDSSFESIWNGPAWVALRQEHLGRRRASPPFFVECDWCYRNRYLDSEDILEPEDARKRLLVFPGR